MIKKIFNSALLTMACLLFNSCEKQNLEPNIDGTWIEIDNTSNQNPTGCEFTVDKYSGKVTLCGFNLVQPKDVFISFRNNSKLNVEDGQFFYEQKNAKIMWMLPVATNLYFIDYDFEGEFLWIVGESTKSKTTALNVGRVFIKKQ